MRLHLLPLLAFGLAAGVSADTTSVQVRMPIRAPTYWTRRLYVVRSSQDNDRYTK